MLHDMEIKHVKSSFPCSLGAFFYCCTFKMQESRHAVAAAPTSTRNARAAQFFYVLVLDLLFPAPALTITNETPAHGMQHRHRTLLTPIVA